MTTFKNRFLAKRDRGLTREESWMSRAAIWRTRTDARPIFREDVLLSLVNPLERLTLEDFEHALLRAAASDALYMTLYIKFSLPKDDAIQVMVRYQTSFLPMLEGTGCYCTFAAPFSDVPSCGVMGFTLFASGDMPEYERTRRLISREDMEQFMAEAGCHRVTMPPQRSQ